MTDSFSRPGTARTDIYQELASLRLIDPHTHINPHSPASTTLADVLGYHYYTELAHSAGMPKSYIEDQSIGPKELVGRLVAGLGPLENTVQYSWLIAICQKFFGFEEDKLHVGNWEALYDRSESVMASAQWSDMVLDQSGVEAVFLTNDFDDDLKGFDSDRYIPCLRTDDLVFHLADPVVRERLAACSGVQLDGSLSSLRASLRQRFEHFVGRGARACAISIPPSFTPTPVSDGRASTAIDAVLRFGLSCDAGHKDALARRVFWTLAELCDEFGLPFDLMIGVNRKVYPSGVYQGQDLFDSRVSLIQYRELFNTFADVKFPVSVLASVTNQELVSYAWIFPNVIPNGHWWYSNTPSTITHDLAARLEAVPQTKLIGYYSDAYKLEFVWPKFDMYRKVLSGVLADQFVGDRGWSIERAVQLGRQVLKENTESIFPRVSLNPGREETTAEADSIPGSMSSGGSSSPENLHPVGTSASQDDDNMRRNDDSGSAPNTAEVVSGMATAAGTLAVAGAAAAAANLIGDDEDDDESLDVNEEFSEDVDSPEAFDPLRTVMVEHTTDEVPEATTSRPSSDANADADRSASAKETIEDFGAFELGEDDLAVFDEVEPLATLDEFESLDELEPLEVDSAESDDDDDEHDTIEDTQPLYRPQSNTQETNETESEQHDESHPEPSAAPEDDDAELGLEDGERLENFDTVVMNPIEMSEELGFAQSPESPDGSDTQPSADESEGLRTAFNESDSAATVVEMPRASRGTAIPALPSIAETIDPVPPTDDAESSEMAESSDSSDDSGELFSFDEDSFGLPNDEDGENEDESAAMDAFATQPVAAKPTEAASESLDNDSFAMPAEDGSEVEGMDDLPIDPIPDDEEIEELNLDNVELLDPSDATPGDSDSMAAALDDEPLDVGDLTDESEVESDDETPSPTIEQLRGDTSFSPDEDSLQLKPDPMTGELTLNSGSSDEQSADDGNDDEFDLKWLEKDDN